MVQFARQLAAELDMECEQMKKKIFFTDFLHAVATYNCKLIFVFFFAVGMEIASCALAVNVNTGFVHRVVHISDYESNDEAG